MKLPAQLPITVISSTDALKGSDNRLAVVIAAAMM